MSGLDADLGLARGTGFRLDMRLVVRPGTTTAVLGPNGAGKSTAVAALAGLAPLDRGYVRLGQATLDDPSAGVFVHPEHRRIGVVFQEPLLFPHLDVAANVAFGLRSRGVARARARSAAEAWLGRMGLTGLGRRRPSDLSGGQAQRVALARALAVEPDLLLLDEPLSALDVTARIEMRHTLAEHLESFTGPRVLITHDPVEAFLLADRILVVESGVITQEGTAEEIRLRPRTPYAAELAGTNLIRATASGGLVDTGAHVLHVVDEGLVGPVLVTIRPSVVSVHLHRPEGSPRNTWQTTVSRMEQLGDRVRVATGAPLPLTVEITAEAARALGLRRDLGVWVAVKATEIGVASDA